MSESFRSLTVDLDTEAVENQQGQKLTKIASLKGVRHNDFYCQRQISSHLWSAEVTVYPGPKHLFKHGRKFQAGPPNIGEIIYFIH